MPQFTILIVGAGLVGLATAIGLQKTGSKVKVVESTATLQVIGDIIAISANQQRVLGHFGVLDDFQACAPKDLGYMNHRRYSTGEIIATRDMKTQQRDYEYATYILSRGRYQQFLYEQAQQLGVEFQFGSRVNRLEDSPSGPAVILNDGLRLEADIIVGADEGWSKVQTGVKSCIRRSMFPEIELISRQNCSRATIPRSRMSDDPELAELLTGINFFMGPGLLAVQSNMTDVDLVSLNLYHPGDTGTAGAWKAAGDLGHLRETFKDFCPQIQKALSMIEECVVWKVVEVPVLPSWRSEGGRVVLVGDAAHAMEPHQGQGCSSGVEDAGALVTCISHAKSLEEVPALLQKYEEIRKPRAELLAVASALAGKIWTMPDGEQQQQRDENMRKAPVWSAGAWDGKPIDELPTGLRDPKYQPWVMSHDAVAFAERRLGQASNT